MTILAFVGAFLIGVIIGVFCGIVVSSKAIVKELNKIIAETSKESERV